MEKPTFEIYKKEIVVKQAHLDDLNHVNNAIYVQWIQEIAGEHWNSRFTEEETQDAHWFVLEHHIQYKQQAFLGDVLQVETTVETPQGVRFPRIVNFYKNGKALVQARTLWCLVDAKTHRPKRVSQAFLDRFKG